MQEELSKEEVFSDYIKVGEIQEKIDCLNKEIEDFMLSWEKYQEEVENIKKQIQKLSGKLEDVLEYTRIT